MQHTLFTHPFLNLSVDKCLNFHPPFQAQNTIPQTAMNVAITTAPAPQANSVIFTKYRMSSRKLVMPVRAIHSDGAVVVVSWVPWLIEVDEPD